MAERDQEQKLEEVLDLMLAAYSSVEPRPGLETRVLANLRAQARQEQGRSRSRLWVWAGAGVAAAVASLALVILFSRAAGPTHPAPIQAGRPVAHSETAPQHIATSERANVHPATTYIPRRVTVAGQEIQRRNVQTQTAVSWPAMFPTPVPLTEQERLMFAYIENTPREEVIAQIVRDEQKEIDAFWEDRERSSGAQRSGNTR